MSTERRASAPTSTSGVSRRSRLLRVRKSTQIPTNSSVSFAGATSSISSSQGTPKPRTATSIPALTTGARTMTPSSAGAAGSPGIRSSMPACASSPSKDGSRTERDSSSGPSSRGTSASTGAPERRCSSICSWTATSRVTSGTGSGSPARERTRVATACWLHWRRPGASTRTATTCEGGFQSSARSRGRSCTSRGKQRTRSSHPSTPLRSSSPRRLRQSRRRAHAGRA